MKLDVRTMRVLVCAGLAAWLTLDLGPALAQDGRGRGAGRGGGMGGFTQSADPRVQNRTYLFTDTNEELPYCVFVSSSVSPDRKAPLVVSLHGLGVGPGFMCQGRALDLAEEGGYILVAPMGYNTGGWYGSPVIAMGGRGGAAATAPPANLAELSAKDVRNVLDIIRREFNVDENRTYLMGHSMGGAGTYFLGSKYAQEWAAIAPIAPAAFMMTENRAAILQPLRAANVPIFVTTGDADELIPVATTRTWVETIRELGITHEYKEYPGVTHGPIIEAAMPDIFAFFAKHTKTDR
jgi:predicted peptidase